MWRQIPLVFVLVCSPAFGAPLILVIGDSLSASYGLESGEGWVDLLQAQLDEEGYDCQIVNASISGDTTRGGLARLPRALEIHHPDLVIIELGGNDGLRGIALREVRSNLSEMVERVIAEQSGVVLIAMRIPPNYGPEYTEKFHRLFYEVGDDYGVPVVPFLLDGIALDPVLMQPDGIHPTAAAQPAIATRVRAALDLPCEQTSNP